MIAVRRSGGFTLLELLVVVAIVGTLAALLVPAVQRVRDAANRIRCDNNLRQIGHALHAYHDVQRVLPPGIKHRPDPYPYLSWSARLLPFLEQESLWKQVQKDYAREPRYWVNPRHAAGSVALAVFLCPADARSRGEVHPEGFDVAFTHYLGVIGQSSGRRDGVLFLDSKVRFADITDGTSNTLMVGERPPSSDHRWGWWYAGIGQEYDGSADSLLGVKDYRTTYRTPTCPQGPYAFGPDDLANDCSIFHFWSMHIGGAHFLMADGSVRFLAYSAEPLLPALSTRQGGESVQLPD